MVGSSDRTRQSPHDLREIAEIHGADAIIERISQLHADGNHHAASDLAWEFVHLGETPTVTDPDYIHLTGDPLDEAVAFELVGLLADRFPVIAAYLSDHPSLPELLYRDPEPSIPAPEFPTPGRRRTS
ncbi:hypothetical protein [Nocardia sp. NPDC051570]|uniref:hypothetical protein n=1 Tax=Nocardia sp. NPDC051570 TaxID=3364324 RepID=UPI003797FC98